MEKQIILREFQKSDYTALENIIRETWHYDELCSPKTAARLAKVYLSNCLANQTFTQVAVAGHQPVGIIMAKKNRTYKCPFRLRARKALAIISLLITKEGRSVTKVFKDVDGIDEELLKSCKKDYQGAISFFAINSKCRGRGLGKRLFHAASDYMTSEHIPEFYLFTDTSCNYKFYEHQGMTRVCQKESFFTINKRKERMQSFLYEYQFPV